MRARRRGTALAATRGEPTCSRYQRSARTSEPARTGNPAIMRRRTSRSQETCLAAARVPSSCSSLRRAADTSGGTTLSGESMRRRGFDAGGGGGLDELMGIPTGIRHYKWPKVKRNG